MPNATPPQSSADPNSASRAGRPPLGPVLIFTWLNSLGTGAVMNGVFFVTRRQYEFTEVQNLSLAFVMGAIYIVGALAVGPALRRLAARSSRVSTRLVLVALMIAMGLVCAVPVLIQQVWSVWFFGAVYATLTGGLWPIIESYVSGGRRGKDLRRAIGAFNLVWASAVAAAYWGMTPFLSDNPLGVIAALGLVHLVCIPLAIAAPREPARHLEDVHEPHPANYYDLLVTFRWLLVLCFILLYVVTPILPTQLEGLDVGEAWATPLASIWMICRVLMFLLMQQWEGWHGRWRTPLWTGGALIGGAAVIIVAPSIPVMIAGLTLFGVGAGGVYCGALYYAMEVGAAEVEAGGKHEAVIGAGYAIGPLIGLGAWGLVGAGLVGADNVSFATLSIVFIVSSLGVAAAVLAGRRGRSRLLSEAVAPDPDESTGH